MKTTRDDDDLGSPEAAALWRRARAGLVLPDAAEPDMLTVAAYVDGTLDPEARDQVEAWMATSPETLELILAARSAAATPASPAPAGLLARARGLVGGRPARSRPAVSGLWAWLAGVTQPSLLAAATAAMLLAAVISFEAGRAATGSLAWVAPVQVDESVDLGLSADDLL